MTIDKILREAIENLRAAGIDNPPMDAALLIGRALKLDRAQLLAQSQRALTDDEITRINSLLARRINREPVARIMGVREFWGLPFAMNEHTLEPRPDSETLIETVLCEVDRQAQLSVLDLGTGTGCLLLSLLHELPNAYGVGIDYADAAVQQATTNTVNLGLAQRAQFRQGDWLNGVVENFDIIISNPPYIVRDEIPTLMPEVRSYDPLAALDGGADGLDAYRAIVPALPTHLNPNGFASGELGQGQEGQVSELFRTNGFRTITQHNDYAGVVRCVMGRI